MGKFYIGKRDALYYRRENGSLSRFGLRLTPDGVQVFDHLLKRWYPLPKVISLLTGGSISIQVLQESESAKNSILSNTDTS